MGGGLLVVSVHDVAPPLEEEVRYLLDVLDRIGARPRVLKVIPIADGRHDIRACPTLVRLLADEAGAGSEIVLHGYTHRASGPARGPGLTRIRARLFAGDVAEFLTLEPAGMVERLVAGRQMLRDIGLDPSGFCAPGWLATPCLPPLLGQCGFRYYVSMLQVRDLATDRRFWTPWMGYMGAGAIQERLVRLGGRMFEILGSRAPVVRVFLHPQRVRESSDFARSVAILARLMRTRRLVTYGSLLAL